MFGSKSKELAEIAELKEFIKVCSSKHSDHDARDLEQLRMATQHGELLKSMADTQTNLVDTQKCLSSSLKVLTEFSKKHEPNLLLVEKTLTTLNSMKYVIGWLAAVIGGLGIIIGGIAAAFIYTMPIAEIFSRIT